MSDDSTLGNVILTQKEIEKEGEKEKFGRWGKHFLAGASAGLVSRTITAPLDRIKIYAQVHGKNPGPIKGMKYMINEGGVFSLWRGNGVNLFKVAPETAVKFLVYDIIKQMFLRDSSHNLTILERFFSGAIAGGLSQTIVYPLDVIKTRRVLLKSENVKGFFEISKQGFHNHGWNFFFRGYLSNIIGIILFTGIDLAIYETIKTQCFHHNEHEKVKGHCVLLSATTSCIIAQLSTYPLSMIGTVAQANDWQKGSQLSISRIALQQRLKKHGVLGLYRGSSSALVKAIPALSITYIVYEKVLKALGTEMT